MKKLTIAILVLGAACPVLAQTAKDVKVVNTPNVTVANTPSVTVANSPAVTVTSNPFVVTSPVNSSTPFNVILPSTTSDGKAIKTVVIEFVTADCDAGAGTTLIGAAKLRVFYAGNFAFYTLPFDPPMSFTSGVEFTSARKTLMFADPGTQLSYGLSAGQPSCTVVFSGHLE